MSGFSELYSGDIGHRNRIVAEIISFVLQPMFVPIPVFLVAASLTPNIAGYGATVAISLTTAFAIPTVIIYWYSFKLNRKDGDIPDKKDRVVPMAIALLSYGVGAVILYLSEAPVVVTALMVSYLVATLIAVLITVKWKISLHATATFGMATALTMISWPMGAISFIAAPLIIWSRYVLRKHTPAQLAAGSVLGVVVTAVAIVIAESL